MPEQRQKRATLRTLADEPLDVTVTAAETDERGMKIAVRLAYPGWRRALREGLFHLDGESEPEGFDSERPVDLQLRLRVPLADDLPADAEKLMTAVGQPGSPLAHTEAWLATEILQESDLAGDIEGVTELKVGERTRWAEPLGPPTAAAVLSEPVLDLLEAFLRSEDWPFTDQGGGFLTFPAGVDEQRSWLVLAHANEETSTCTLFSILSSRVPASDRPQAALRLAGRNHQLGHDGKGCFDLDPESGEVRYRSTFAVFEMRHLRAGIHDHLSTMAASFDALTELTG